MSLNNPISNAHIDIKIEHDSHKMNKKIDQFFKNYEIKVENNMRRRAIRRPPPMYFTDPTDASICVSDHAHIQEELLYTISIPESRLKALVELEERMSRYVHVDGGHDLLSALLDKERQEATLRQQNEGIKKAYEQYSMLLNLAGYQREY